MLPVTCALVCLNPDAVDLFYQTIRKQLDFDYSHPYFDLYLSGLYRVLSDLLIDDSGIFHGEERWVLSLILREKVYELYEHLEFLMEEQREIQQKDVKSQ